MELTREIKAFVIAEFAPDLTEADLDADYDLLDGGVIDSLGLLKVIAWLEDRFGLDSDSIELAPERFRTVRAIQELITGARTGVN